MRWLIKLCSWTESSLKSFLDHHNIPAPQPRTRDSYLAAARQNYDSIAKKAGEYSAYPGDWLYKSWSESDLKEFLDARGIPAPQPSTRDKLIAKVRRNSRQATLSMEGAASSASKSVASGASVASASAASAQASLGDMLFDSWSDSKLKEFFDSNGIPVPQGSKRNEMVALARKHAAALTGNEKSTASASGASAFGAATSKAGNAAAKATDDAAAMSEDVFNSAIDTWSDSRLKGFLDSRGVPVPQSGKRDEILAKVRLNKHKASTGYSAWTFDTWTVDNLNKYLSGTTKKYKAKSGATRDDLVKQAQAAYSSASKSGGTNYASVTSYLASATAAAKDESFDTWSDSDLKSYLDSYGVRNYQGSTTNELRALAKRQATYFRYGTSSPSGTIVQRLQDGFQWMLDLARGGAAQGAASGSSAASVASASASSTKNEL